jgi:uncharacterized protein (TIGR03663 family)
MIPRPFFAAAVILLTAAALCFRLPNLGNRPFHGDEAVHAVKFRDLWEHGSYEYDPNEFHGPTIYYAALPTVALSGHHRFADTQEADYRLATALLGGLMIPVLVLLRRFIGSQGVMWAAVLTAVSSSMVFYSRYFIQEIALVCFTLAFWACGWNYRVSRTTGWLIGAGIAAGLMIATKETAVLTFFAAGIAWLVTARAPREHGRTRPPWTPLVIGTVVAVFVAYACLSGFFTHLAGPLGYFKTYTPWLQRAGGTDLHKFPWTHYFTLYFWHHPAGSPVWSEALIPALALVGGAVAFLKRDASSQDTDLTFLRFLAVYTILLTAIYSAIPYKTPWNAISFLSGMILLAGFGAAALINAIRPRFLKAALSLAILGASAQLGLQAYRASFEMFADQKYPYVYAQPVPEIAKLKTFAEDIARASGDGDRMVVKVVWNDPYYWPIPWYLRRLENVGYWAQLPQDPIAPLVLFAPEMDEALTAKLDPTHIMTGFYGLRPGIPVGTFVDMKVWEKYLKARPKPEEE